MSATWQRKLIPFSRYYQPTLFPCQKVPRGLLLAGLLYTASSTTELLPFECWLNGKQIVSVLISHRACSRPIIFEVRFLKSCAWSPCCDASCWLSFLSAKPLCLLELEVVHSCSWPTGCCPLNGPFFKMISVKVRLEYVVPIFKRGFVLPLLSYWIRAARTVSDDGLSIEMIRHYQNVWLLVLLGSIGSLDRDNLKRLLWMPGVCPL